jgi:spore coat polysaccharide biosynthesis predicted glycosyltransferase SpsG
LRIALLTKGGQELGMGHVYRTLTIADELRLVSDVEFLTNRNEAVAQKVTTSGFRVHIVDTMKQVYDNIERIAPDILIIDLLDVETQVVENVKNLGIKRVILFDSTSEVRRFSDVTINALVEDNLRNSKAYFGDNLHLVGPRYLFLRKEFCKADILENDIETQSGGTLLLFGGSDPANLSTKVLEHMLESKLDTRFTVVLGPAFAHDDSLEELLDHNPKMRKNITILRDIANVEEVMRAHSLVITSPGLTMFEALALKKPTVVYCQNELQKRVYKEFLERFGSDSDDWNSETKGVHLNPADLEDLSIGSGRMEVLEAITNLTRQIRVDSETTVSIRQATDEDLELIMAWRSNPMIYENFSLQNAPLIWNEHHNWWIRRKDRVDWIIMLDDGTKMRAVGSVNASGFSIGKPEIGVFVGEVTLWGKSVGRSSVRLVVNWLREIGHSMVYARVMKHNVRSMKLFESLGFSKLEVTDEGEWLYGIQL